MEEENNNVVEPEVQQEVKAETKKIDIKKYIPIIGIAVGVIAVIVILFTIFGGGPEKTVKKYIKEMNNSAKLTVTVQEKILKLTDEVGARVWGYTYDAEDFSEEDYDKFIEEYDALKEEIEEDDDEEENMSYETKLDKIIKTEKLGKGLYLVKAKIITKKGDNQNTETSEFIVYNNKVIEPSLSSMFF